MGSAVGPVVVVESSLLLDRMALVIEIGLGDVQGPHPVSLQEHAEFQLIRWQRLKVSSPVGIGRAVGVAAVV